MNRWLWTMLACVAMLLAGTAQADPTDLAAPTAASAAATSVVVGAGQWVHALSAFSPPKYPPGFAHFDYVNPDAPKGGLLNLANPDRRSSFDKFNPFTVKGVPPAAVMILMVESLATMGQDEPMAMYGLLAEAMWAAPDLSSISFRIHPRARFANGDPVTPADVLHSYQALSAAGAYPRYRAPLAGVAGVVVVDERTVRIDLKERSLDTLFNAGTMPVFSRHWGAGKQMDDISSELPITSGAYVIDSFEMPRRVALKRNPAYWARDLGVRRGMFNFDRIEYRMYQDRDISLEAFKAGEFDLVKEYSARAWARRHEGVKWRDGRILKQALPTRTGKGMQATLFNQRRPLLQDIRVREALTLAWDFSNYNRYGSFVRTESVFPNSDFAAQGLPSPGELALLAPWRAALPPRVFGPAFVAPRTGTGANGLRDNLKRARDLLAQAGWTVAPDGLLRNAQGQPFELEYLEPSVSGRTVMWQRNLQKLGISLKERLVDFALYQRRLEKFDFDLVTIINPDFTLPSAADMAGLFASKAADNEGSNNWRGVKSPPADALLKALGEATNPAALRDAARAFDRVVMWSFWQMPEVFNNKEQVSYWDKFGMPKTLPHHFKIDALLVGYTDFGPWPVWTWWDKSLSRPAATAATPASAALTPAASKP